MPNFLQDRLDELKAERVRKSQKQEALYERLRLIGRQIEVFWEQKTPNFISVDMHDKQTLAVACNESDIALIKIISEDEFVTTVTGKAEQAGQTLTQVADMLLSIVPR